MNESMNENYKAPEGSTDGCMDWDDAIENDGQEFVILPEGDYNFTVVDFERGRYPGSAKIPACNKATLTLQVKTDEGVAMIREDLILYKSLEWKLSGFFRCIGQKKHGERLVMNWNKVPGAQGRAHFKPRSYTNKEGEERQANAVVKYYDYEDKFFANETAFKPVVEDTEDIPFE